jgi:hypothetical protein
MAERIYILASCMHRSSEVVLYIPLAFYKHLYSETCPFIFLLSPKYTYLLNVAPFTFFLLPTYTRLLKQLFIFPWHPAYTCILILALALYSALTSHWFVRWSGDARQLANEGRHNPCLLPNTLYDWYPA